ncbi:hypothetical protein DSO57_1021482, partial [Entomophthora muscae]
TFPDLPQVPILMLYNKKGQGGVTTNINFLPANVSHNTQGAPIDVLVRYKIKKDTI